MSFSKGLQKIESRMNEMLSLNSFKWCNKRQEIENISDGLESLDSDCNNSQDEINKIE